MSNRKENKEMNVSLVSFIIVNYNGKHYLKKCIDSIKQQDYPSDKVGIILVDNGSKDDSIAFVKKQYKTVRVINNKENDYCSANNLGIRKAKGEFVALVNNDAILEKNWLRELVKEITSDKKIAGVGGKIYFMNGRIQSAGQKQLDNYRWTDIGFKEKDVGQYNRKKEVVSLSGAAVLYRKKCLLEIGGFDEDFKMYCDEADMGLRINKKGWKLVYVPTAIARHKFMGTASKKLVNYYCARNKLLLAAKHEPESLFRIFSEQKKEIQDMKNKVILIKNRIIKDREAQIRLKDKLLLMKDKELNKRNKELNKQSDQVNQLHKLLIDKEKKINDKKKEIYNLNKLLAEKEKMIKQRDKSLKEIYESRGWKLLTNVHTAKKKLGMIK